MKPSQVSSNLQRQPSKDIDIMLVFTLMVVALATTVSQQVTGNPVNDEAIIKDPINDLSWLRVLPRRHQQASSSKLSDQKLEAGASAFHDSTVMPNKYKSFSDLLSISSIPSGKRRLDTDASQLTFATQSDIEALASSGRQSRRNMEARLYQQQQGRGNKRLNSRYGSDQDSGPLDHESQVRQMNQLYNRNYQNQMQQANELVGQGQADRRSSSAGGTKRQLQLQESRKNQRRPQVGGQEHQVARSSGNKRRASAKVTDEFEGGSGDDGSYDEDRNLVSNRRSDGIVDDGAERDEDVVEDDEDSGERDGNSGARRARKSSRQQSGRLSAAPSRQRPRSKKQPDEEDSADSDSDGDSDGDNDGDESVESAVRSPDAGSNSPLNTQVARLAGNEAAKVGGGGDEDGAASQQLLHSSAELQTAAGHHHGHHGHYYQHVEVPKKKTWKFGFKRGNHKHEIEKHEKGHKHKFHTTFKWHAKEKCKKKKKCKSVGKMTWEYKHAKKHHH